MPLKILRADLTKLKVDAVVNAANKSLLGGGGVDGAIHRAAGPRLVEECRTLNGCETGEAKATKGYDLPAKYVIHTVGPIWRGGRYGEKELLISCYRRSLEIAAELGCETVAFPLISAGAYGYPLEQVLTIAEETIRDFLNDDAHDDMTITLTVFGHRAAYIAGQRHHDLKALIDDAYTDALEESEYYRHRRIQEEGDDILSGCDKAEELAGRREAYRESLMRSRPVMAPDSVSSLPKSSASLEDMLNTIDESFVEMLLRKIDESGMKDSECYRRANVDRRLFSKIRKDMNYKPSKQTAIAFAIALELPLNEAEDMLMKAGYALSRSSRFDIIVTYFIKNKIYDIMEINNALFDFDQPLLGA